MAAKLTEEQKRTVDEIVKNMEEYLNARRQMTVRANPKIEGLWPDLQYLLLIQFRITMEGDKMWGPERYIVGDILTGDDKQKIRDLYTPTNQRSILTEIVEKAEDKSQTTGDVMQIHDFKTLYSAIDPSISEAAVVMETYMWWDLPFACDLARMTLRLERFRKVKENYTESLQQIYDHSMELPEGKKPEQEDALIWETLNVLETMEAFHLRREAEAGYQAIIANRQTKDATSQADQLIGALARELVILKKIDDGEELETAVREKIAGAMQMGPSNVTNEIARSYLTNIVTDQKARLQELLSGHTVGGERYNFRQAQLERMQKVYMETVGEYHKKALAHRRETKANNSQSQTNVEKRS